MATNIDIVRQSISVITKILADRDIEVTQTGTGAYVKAKNGIPVLVNIPYIPDNASDELILAINGFLDHEVAHILFTDFSPDIAKSMPSKMAFGILNILEDCRIETCMQKRFAGSAMNLDGVREFLIEKHMTPEFEKALSGGDKKVIISSLVVSAMRAWAGQEPFVNFMKDKWHHISELSEKIKDKIPRISTLASTRDAAKLAIEIFELMSEPKSESKEPEKEPEKSGKRSKDKDSEDDGESSESGDDGKDDGKKPDCEGGSKGEESTEGDDSEESGSGKEGGADEGDDSEELEDWSTYSESEEELGDESESGESGFSDDAGEFSDIELGDDVSKIISKHISDEAKSELSSSRYRIFTTDFDTIEPVEIPRSSVEETERLMLGMQSETMHITGPLQKTLERMIKAKTKVRNIPGKRSGSVNPSSLFRLKTGDDRVFRQKDMGISNDVAVSVLIDCSGSMGGSKIRLAMLSALAICDVLSRTNITCEAIGFTTHCRYRGSEMGDKMEKALSADKDRHMYSRIEALKMPIFKSFKEGFGPQQKMRLAYMSRGGGLKNNVDGECLRIAARRLVSMTKEMGKQIIVLSDGLPEAQGNRSHIVRDLRDAVSDVEKMGVSVVGIGIEDRSVKDYYKKNTVINDVSELPAAIIRELKSILIG